MSEPVQLAKAAREQLAAALNALQTSDVPDELVDAAEPIAQAMGVLHRIERTNGGNLDGRSEALAWVRQGLDRVQKVDSAHPAVEKVPRLIGDLPVRAADVRRLGEKIRHPAGVEILLAGRAPGQQLAPPRLERPVQAHHESQRVGAEDLREGGRYGSKKGQAGRETGALRSGLGNGAHGKSPEEGRAGKVYVLRRIFAMKYAIS